MTEVTVESAPIALLSDTIVPEMKPSADKSFWMATISASVLLTLVFLAAFVFAPEIRETSMNMLSKINFGTNSGSVPENVTVVEMWKLNKTYIPGEIEQVKPIENVWNGSSHEVAVRSSSSVMKAANDTNYPHVLSAPELLFNNTFVEYMDENEVDEDKSHCNLRGGHCSGTSYGSQLFGSFSAGFDINLNIFG